MGIRVGRARVSSGSGPPVLRASSVPPTAREKGGPDGCCRAPRLESARDTAVLPPALAWRARSSGGGEQAPWLIRPSRRLFGFRDRPPRPAAPELPRTHQSDEVRAGSPAPRGRPTGFDRRPADDTERWAGRHLADEEGECADDCDDRHRPPSGLRGLLRGRRCAPSRPRGATPGSPSGTRCPRRPQGCSGRHSAGLDTRGGSARAWLEAAFRPRSGGLRGAGRMVRTQHIRSGCDTERGDSALRTRPCSVGCAT